MQNQTEDNMPGEEAAPENDKAAVASEIEGNATASKITVAKDELEALRKKAEERDLYRNELLRSKADFENYQKRMRKEKPAWEDQAVRRFLRDLLPVRDNLERALAHAGGEKSSAKGFEEGIRLTLEMLKGVLADHSVEEIPAEDMPFNPELHEAVSQVEAPGRPGGHVAEVLEKGYKHREAVLRPAKVTVTKQDRRGHD